MVQNIEKWIERFPEEESVKHVTTHIKGMKELAIFDFLSPYLDTTEGRARIALLKLLVKKINKKQPLLTLLEIGISKKMASEIGYWLKLLVPKIGVERFVTSLLSIEDKQAKEIAEYHIKFFEPKIRDAVNEEIGNRLKENLH